MKMKACAELSNLNNKVMMFRYDYFIRKVSINFQCDQQFL